MANENQESEDVVRAVEKMPGWEHMFRLLDMMLSARVKLWPRFATRDDAAMYKEIEEIIIINCIARRHDVFPAEVIPRLIQKLMNAISHGGFEWESNIIQFILSQAGEQTILDYVAAHPEWTLKREKCGPTCHGIRVINESRSAIVEAKVRELAELAQRLKNPPPTLDDIVEDATSGFGPGIVVPWPGQRT